MKKLIHLTIIYILLFATGTKAQSNTLTQTADSLFNSLHATGKFNGNVLLAENGKVLYEKSFGFANQTTKAPLNENSIFELASCSKQFTAMAIALLQQQGKLNVDDDFTKYIPELNFYKNITISNLIYHTSGIPDYMQLDSMWMDWDEHKIANNGDVIKKFVQYKPALLFTTGSKHEYSNTGYALLASIIERASGMSFGDYLQKNIFKPLKMDHSFVYNRRYAPKKVDNYAFGYVMDDSLNKLVLPDSYMYTQYVYNFDGIVGDGCVNSTVNDLLKWDDALYTNKLLPATVMKTIFESGKLNDGTPTNYGFGWFIKDKPDGTKIVSHSGGWPGYITYIERNMTSHKTIILLQNGPGVIPTKEIRLIMDGKPIPAAPVYNEIKLPENTLSAYTGQYKLDEEFILTVTKEGTQLYAQATGQNKFPIYAYAPDKFFVKVVDAHMEFITEGGKITKMMFHQGGADIPAPKID
ncbi:serine hydrolase [Taibaiella lutea]|uniref:Serine hydrolase n=1 Tax=Taibaiella lutea TaxID=2608001 RepID=A0A5M6CEE9_9BACT|nr:serine hydrolase [Taibaiella lutea]KAA5532252.1 serine hydrolase [Taibaiella lutea]